MEKKIKVLKSLKILLMEDEESLRDLFRDILKEIFAEVIVAKDGEEGLALYEQYYDSDNTIDIVLSDVNMPIMNGLEAAKVIKKLDSRIPIVFLTGHSDTKYLLQAINIGAAQYIFKPVEIIDLIYKLYDAHLPIHQFNLIEQKNTQLKELNKKIIETTKNEAHKFIMNDDDYFHFEDFLDSIELDD